MGTFQLFVYGARRAAGGPECAGDAGHSRRAASLPSGCERIGRGSVRGTLYDIDGRFPALMLYGDTVVSGEIWRCPAETLPRLDASEGVAEGLFRRIAVAVAAESGNEVACWCYVAGAALARRLTPERRVAEWRPSATSA